MRLNPAKNKGSNIKKLTQQGLRIQNILKKNNCRAPASENSWLSETSHNIVLMFDGNSLIEGLKSFDHTTSIIIIKK